MFPSRYFNGKYFPSRYFPKIGAILLTFFNKEAFKNQAEVNLIDNIAEDCIINNEVVMLPRKC